MMINSKKIKYNCFDDKDNDFISIEIENDLLKVSLDKRFFPENEMEKKFIEYALNLLNGEINKINAYNKLGNINIDTIEHIMGNNLYENEYFKKLKTSLINNIINEEDFRKLISLRISNDESGFNNYSSALFKKYIFSIDDIEDNVDNKNKIIQEYKKFIDNIKKKIIISPNIKANSIFKTFTIENNKSELKGTFFEIILQLLFYRDINYNFISDYSGFHKDDDNRDKDNIYPDIIGISEDKEKIIIIDAKCYKSTSKVSIKEVLLNEVVLINTIKETQIKQIPLIYNIAIVPIKSEETICIKKIKIIKSHKVVIVEINPFKFFNEGKTIDCIIKKINDFKNEDRIVLNKKMSSWIINTLKN